MRSVRGSAFIAALAALVLVACGGGQPGEVAAGGGEAASPEDQATQPQDQEESAGDLTEVRITYPTIWTPTVNLGIVLANTDIAQSNGLNLTHRFNIAGGTANEAFISREVDADMIGDGPTVVLNAKVGDEVLNVAKAVEYRVGICVRNDSGISELANLEGKTVGTIFTSSVHGILINLLADAGIDPANVNIVAVDAADQVQAVRAGELDAFAQAAPQTTQCRVDDELELIYDEPGGIGTLRMRSEFIESNREAAVAFVRSFMQAWAYMLQNREQVEGWVADQFFAGDSEIVHLGSLDDSRYGEAERLEDIDFEIADDDVKLMNDILVKFFVEEGVIDEQIDIRDYIDMSLLSEARESIPDDWSPEDVTVTVP